MIKIGLFPGSFIMTARAIGAQVSFVPIIIGMTVETIFGRLAKFFICGMTSIATRAAIGVSAGQGKIREIMIESFSFETDAVEIAAFMFRVALPALFFVDPAGTPVEPLMSIEIFHNFFMTIQA